jgi:hypothetical protein
MAEERSVHGYRVMFEKDAIDGVHYLDERLDSDCAKVFFVYAQHYQSAPFRDAQDRKYLLDYKNGVYMLEKK